MQNKLFFDGTLDIRNRVRVARRKTSNKKRKVSSPEINEMVSRHLSSVSDCCKQILVVLVQRPPHFAITIDSNLDLHFHYNYNILCMYNMYNMLCIIYHTYMILWPGLYFTTITTIRPTCVNIKCSWAVEPSCVR